MKRLSRFVRIKDESNLAKKTGIEEGKTSGMNLLNELNMHLIQDNRLEDLKAATTDMELQKKLFKEYEIEV
ncbi:MAG TPA: hypothetical protein DEO83_07235 [Lachnospiraceae bacterium]|jgi:hypothetical protein|nr:hypothetical protein [Eubacterium sp.]HBZ03583.1 hypothetical protein [Lachnospiraceae bacterium]